LIGLGKKTLVFGKVRDENDPDLNTLPESLFVKGLICPGAIPAGLLKDPVPFQETYCWQSYVLL
jgi:hypothetical protein